MTKQEAYSRRRRGPARQRAALPGGVVAVTPPRLKLAPPVPSEAEVLAMVQQYLAAHPKVARVIRINSGAAWMGKGEQKQFVRFCEIYGQAAIRRAAAPSGRRGRSGSAALQKAAEEMTELVPDLIGFLTDGRFLAIECKRGGWKKPAGAREKAQERFLDAVRASGGVAGFVASLGDLEALIG